MFAHQITRGDLPVIALSVSMTLAPDDFAKAREFTTSLAELSRKDAGCVEYWWA